MITIVTEPAEEPITLTEAKAHLRVDVDADDTLITSQIKAARMHCEAFTRRAFVTQTLDLALDAWAAGNLELWRPPLQSVTSVTYTDADGNATVLDAANYEVDTYDGRIRFTSLPAATLRHMSGVVIRYVAGYGDAEDVPEIIKQAILLTLGDLYLFRESSITQAVNEIPLSAQMLLWPVRSWRRHK